MARLRNKCIGDAGMLPRTVWMIPKVNEWNKFNELFSASIEKQNLKVKKLTVRDIFLSMRKGDVVHFHWPARIYQGKSKVSTFLMSSVFFAMIFCFKLRGIRIVWTVHNMYPHNYISRKMEKKIRRLFISQCNRLIVASQSIKEELVKEFTVNPNRVEVVYHGHYCGAYPSKNIDLRAHYKISEDKIVFLFVGAIQDYKGVPQLLEAYSRLESNHIHLVVAGKIYSDMTDLVSKNTNKENITFDLRFIPDDELVDLIHCSDYVVLPYKNITTSGTAILSVSLKKKIICPATPFMREYFNQGTAIMYDMDQPDGLYDQLRKCTQMNKHQNITESSFKNFIDRLSWDKIGRKMKEIYLSL